MNEWTGMIMKTKIMIMNIHYKTYLLKSNDCGFFQHFNGATSSCFFMARKTHPPKRPCAKRHSHIKIIDWTFSLYKTWLLQWMERMHALKGGWGEKLEISSNAHPERILVMEWFFQFSQQTYHITLLSAVKIDEIKWFLYLSRLTTIVSFFRQWSEWVSQCHFSWGIHFI
jgi:hypothetical protein